MAWVLWGWVIAAALLLLFAAALGLRAINRGLFGILIDQRGRYSLTQVQLVLWSIVVLSLIAGVFWGRLAGGLAQNALNFTIPTNLLLVLGISVGSAAATTVIKAQKDSSTPDTIAASHPDLLISPPPFAQVFLVEEGAMADKVIDVTKFQNFWITLILVGAYVAQSVSYVLGLSAIADLTTLPDFSQNFVTLLGISHAGYIVGKIPNQAGTPAVSMQTVQALQAQQVAPVAPVALVAPPVQPAPPAQPAAPTPT